MRLWTRRKQKRADMPRLRWGSLSITGDFRENNEDRCLADPQGRYFLVADGMGGQAAGEKASELAIELLSRYFDQTIDFEKSSAETVKSCVNTAVERANAEIMALGEVDPNYHSMGTTVAFFISVAGSFYIGGVGDSRVYRFHGAALEQLTTDHSLTQALVDAGTLSAEEAASHRYRNILYRYLGTKEGGSGVDIKSLEPQSGDRYLLCSDGLTDGLSLEILEEFLQKQEEPQAVVDALVAAAQQGGSRDNITCIVVDVE